MTQKSFEFDTKLGRIILHWNDEGKLSRIDWSPDEGPIGVQQSFPFLPAPVNAVLVSFSDYFNLGKPLGKLELDLIDTSGWTEFQRAVYLAAAEIPHGETRTYSWIASRVGKFGANRAVGQALKRNPLPIIIPCHRVTSALSLGGFMGCIDPNDPELKLKRQLITLEEEYLNPVFPFLQATA